MAPTFSKPENVARLTEHYRRSVVYYPPPVPFEKTDKKSKKKKEESDYKTVDLKVDPTDKKSDKIEKKVLIFSDGTTEEWIRWRIEFDECVRDVPLESSNSKTKMAIALLKGRALELFQQYNHELIAKNVALPADERKDLSDVFWDVIDKVGTAFFPENAWRLQTNYMNYNLFMGDHTVAEFTQRLKQLNSYLPYFPKKHDGTKREPLDEDQLIDILNRAKPNDWHATMLGADIDPYSMTWDRMVAYFERLEMRESLKTQHGSDSKKSGKKRKRDADEKADNKPKKGKCKHCGKFGHDSKDCWELPENKNKKPSFKKQRTETKKKGTPLTQETFMAMLKTLPMYGESAKKKKKRKVHFESESDDDSGKAAHFFAKKADDNSTSDSDNEPYFYSFKSTLEEADMVKKTKTSHKATELIVEIVDREGEKMAIRALVDTGTTGTMILRQYVSPKCAMGYKGKPINWTTLGGTFQSKRKAILEFKFPEFSLNKTIQWKCHVDDTTDHKKAQYDMIIGTDLLSELGLSIDFKHHTMTWEDVEVPMKERGTLAEANRLQEIYHMELEPPVLKEAEERQKRILDANYSALDIDSYVKELTHLSDDEKTLLRTTLHKYPDSFKGGLGTLNIKPVHLELKSGAKPYHARAFPIPKAYEATTKKEIERFERIGVLMRDHESEWAAPTFIQPKKTGDVRVLTDFRELNKYIVRKPFPLPKISDILQKLEGFTYATALDLSMGYYHIPLDEASSKLCTTILPWGKYRYLRLPMGIKNSPDIFQAIMQGLMADLEYVRAYIDDILIISNGTFEDHMRKVSEVLARLEKAGFMVNLRKSFFALDKVEYLGFWLTRDGIQPQPKKVEAIQRLQPPKTKRQLRHFLGMVNYYRDMWRRRSHLLAPLTAMCSAKAKFIWGKDQQKAFEDIKKVVSRETMLAFPDFNKPFHVYTDASDYQLGAVIMQDDKPLAFYSRKMNGAQRRYTTGEQELLSIVETLKEYRNILLGQKIIIHTDHQNILYNKMASDRIVRWRLLLEEFGPEFRHVAGKDNVIADALSRLEADFPPEPEDATSEANGCFLAYCVSHMEAKPTDGSGETQPPDMDELAHSFVLHNEEKETDFPLAPTLIAKHQKRDKTLQRNVLLHKGDSKYSTTILEGVEVITENSKVYIPSKLQSRVVAWYHEYLAHPGEKRTEETIRQNLTWPGLRTQVRQFCKTCKQCQLCKKQRKKYGHLPVKNVECVPWEQVHVDLIGPYEIRTPTQKHVLRAFTAIDPATGWFEVTGIPDKSAETIMDAFNNTWLTRYPRPKIVKYDNGSEFKALFKEMCDNYGLTSKPTTTYNPQSNGVIERVHLVLGDSLRTFELEKQELPKHDPFGSFLSAAAWAIRSTYHTTLEATPGQLVFGRDMLLPIKFQADWARIRKKKQETTERNNAAENIKRHNHEYKPGDKVLLEKPGIVPKMSTPRTGPYDVLQVYTNGTVKIRRGPVQEKVSIRRLTPYHARPSGSA